MPDSQPTIHSSIHDLRDILKTVCDQWDVPLQTGFGSLPSDASPRADRLHVLSRVNIDKSRLDFERTVTSIRAVCAQFDTEVAPELAKMGPQAEAGFRRYGSLLKEQSLLESAVQNTKRSLRTCYGLIDDATVHDAEQKTRRIIKKLEAITKEFGLKTYIETPTGVPVTSILIEGKIIVVDIDIESIGAVLKVKVSYASEMHQDDRVDLILAENLRSYDAPSFRRNLGLLAQCDRFNGLYPAVDFFVAIRNLAADFRSIWQQEMLVCMDDFPTVLTAGHGVPLLHGVHPGLSLAYWASRGVMADMDWEELRGFLERGDPGRNLDQLARLWIQFEESRRPMAFLPASRGQYLLTHDESDESVQARDDGAHLDVTIEQTYPHFTTPCRFVQPLPSSPAIAMLRFVAWVDPPVVVAEGVTKAIAQLVGVGGVSEVSNQTYKNGTTAGGATLSLEELLIVDAVPNSAYATRPTGRPSVLLKPEVQWETTFADIPIVQKYSFVGVAETSARVIDRIPFAHPMQLFAVMQCLRQQLIFNALFQSCFNSQTYQSTSSNPQTALISLDDILNDVPSFNTTTINPVPTHRTIQLELSVRHPPHFLFVTFSHPLRPFALISLEIAVSTQAPVQPSVRVVPRPRGSETDPVFDEHKMTQVLRACESIPVLIRWLCRRLEREGGGKIRGREEVEWEQAEEDMFGLKRYRVEY